MTTNIGISTYILVGLAFMGCGCSGDQSPEMSNANSKMEQEGTPDYTKFDSALRAAASISGAQKIGLTHDKFQELLQQLSTEVVILEGRIEGEKESEVYNAFKGILGTYEDSNLLWKQQREYASHSKAYEDANFPYTASGQADRHLKGIKLTAKEEADFYNAAALFLVFSNAAEHQHIPVQTLPEPLLEKFGIEKNALLDLSYIESKYALTTVELPKGLKKATPIEWYDSGSIQILWKRASEKFQGTHRLMQ